MRVILFGEAFVRQSEFLGRAFLDGAKRSGDEVHIAGRPSTLKRHKDDDIAVYSSGPKPSGGALTKTRQEILDRYPRNRRVCIESAAFRHGMPTANIDGTYWRTGLGGFLCDEADYANENSPPDRWEQVARKQKIRLAEFDDTDPGRVLIILQRIHDASLRGIDIYAWAETMARNIREILGDVEVLARHHPNQPEHKKPPVPGCTMTKSARGNLGADLARVGRVFTYTSLSAIESICAGKPTYVAHPGSMSWPMRQISVRKPEPPDHDKLMQWLYDTAYSQWTIDEIRKGIPWRRLRARALS